MENELSLDKEKTAVYKARASYNVEKHLKVLALNDKTFPQDPNDEDYGYAIGKFLIKNIRKQNHILVLFTNLETIKEAFSEIVNASELKDYEILAQNLTGSNEKIAKRFAIAKKAILLGANSFWEGIDFKDTSVDIAIVTKLPFESPEQPEVRLREEKLKAKYGIHQIFEVDTLPRALIRFRQGCGRLIRNERDHGIFIILDQRIWYKNYGQRFLESLPVGAKKVDLKQINQILKDESINE